MVLVHSIGINERFICIYLMLVCLCPTDLIVFHFCVFLPLFALYICPIAEYYIMQYDSHFCLIDFVLFKSIWLALILPYIVFVLKLV